MGCTGDGVDVESELTATECRDLSCAFSATDGVPLTMTTEVVTTPTFVTVLCTSQQKPKVN